LVDLSNHAGLRARSFELPLDRGAVSWSADFMIERRGFLPISAPRTFEDFSDSKG